MPDVDQDQAAEYVQSGFGSKSVLFLTSSVKLPNPLLHNPNFD